MKTAQTRFPPVAVLFNKYKMLQRELRYRHPHSRAGVRCPRCQGGATGRYLSVSATPARFAQIVIDVEIL